MEDKINKVINDLKESMNNKNINNITSILNIQFNLGKYHALMDILEEENFDKYIEIAENTKEVANEALIKTDTIYSYRK